MPSPSEGDLREIVTSLSQRYCGLGYVYDGRIRFSANQASPCAHFCNNDRGKVLSAACKAFYQDLSGDPYVTKTCPAGFKILFARLDDMLKRSAGLCVHLECGPSDPKTVAVDVHARCGPKERKALRRSLARVTPWRHPQLANPHELGTIVGHVRVEVESRVVQSQAVHMESLLANEDNATFVDSFAHEVFTPLQTIRTSLERADIELRKGSMSPSNVSDIIRTSLLGVERVRVAVTGMRLLFNDDPSIERNRLRTVDLLHIVRVWEDIHRDEIESKNLKIIYKNAAEGSKWLVSAVPEYLEIVVRNMVSNAVKYSYDTSRYDDSQPGKILFGYSSNVGTFRITSYGVPIRQEEIASGAIFGLTHRGSQSGDRGRQGRGVGLFLVKKVCDLHGWKVAVSSDVINPTRPPAIHCAKTEFSIGLTPATERFRRRERRRW